MGYKIMIHLSKKMFKGLLSPKVILFLDIDTKQYKIL